MSQFKPEYLKKEGSLSLKKAELPEGVIRLVATDETIDRHGDIIIAKGVDFTDFLKNPVIFWQHESYKIPIGKAVDIFEENDTVFIDVEFDLEDPEAIKVYGKLKRGFLNAGSIGAQVKKAKPREGDQGWIIEECSLVEYSIVSVPANPNAVVIQRSFEGMNVNALKEAAQMILSAISKMEEEPVEEEVKMLTLSEDESEAVSRVLSLSQELSELMSSVGEEWSEDEKEAVKDAMSEAQEVISEALEAMEDDGEEDESEEEDEVGEGEEDPSDVEESFIFPEDGNSSVESNDESPIDLSKLFFELEEDDLTPIDITKIDFDSL